MRNEILTNEGILAVLALIISLLASAITIMQERRFNHVSHMPVLVINYDGSAERFYIHNVGDGPALNIVVAQLTEGPIPYWYNPVSIPAIESGGRFVLEWLEDGGSWEEEGGDFALGAQYGDGRYHHKSRYFTFTRHDSNAVFDFAAAPKPRMPQYEPSQISRHWQAGLTWRRPTADQSD